jgi:hypothetical protein
VLVLINLSPGFPPGLPTTLMLVPNTDAHNTNP